jgi:predicted lipid-binding transport protein (Tim44 family)
MPSPANGQESNNMENVKMLKTLTAIGISAAIVFAPFAAIAQTDTTAPAAGAPAATDNMAPAKDTAMKPKKAKKHMAKKAKKPAADDATPAAPAEAPKS